MKDVERCHGDERPWKTILALALVPALALTEGCGSSPGDQPDGGVDQDDGGSEADAGPLPELELCGQTPGSIPTVQTVASTTAGDGQNAAYCGGYFPTLDLATSDPFAADRYDPPSDRLIPPFEACIDELRASLSSRPLCDQVTDRHTLLVSKSGESDPRWQTGSFDQVYDTIQAAIDAAAHCDTIIVRPGTYREYLVIADKDVQIFSDTWNQDGTSEDGDQRATDYVAERIDLGHYYETGERVVLESRQPFHKPLRRAVRTILEGGGYAEGPTLGGTLDRDPEDPNDPNRGCGNRRPMVDFKAGTTRNTVFDGFTVRLMPQQDHTIPGHGHTLQCRGGSPIIRHNLIYNNGSTGVGVHANFVDTSPVTPPCQAHPELAQETFSNADYRASNIAYRPVPLVYDNISYQNNGLGLGNNHYSCATMVDNEAFWNAVPGEEDEHQSPGIGTRHGAKTCLDRNIVYQNAWTGIAVRQGFLQPEAACADDPVGCNHIDERTQAVVMRNITFDNGSDLAPEDSRGGIAVDGVGLPDQPVVIRENVSFESRVSGIGVRNQFAGADRGFVLDDSYVEIVDNVSFDNSQQGVTCQGSDYGTAYCTIVGNQSFWNHTGGIGFSDQAQGSALHNVSACNTSAGFQTTEIADGNQIPMLNNIAWANVAAGIMDLGSLHDYNLLSANAGQEPDCGDEPQGLQCKNRQVGVQSGGSMGANELFVDPEFVDALAFDFAVSASSPAVDSGTDVSSYYPSWPVEGSAPDRGSHEQ